MKWRHLFKPALTTCPPSPRTETSFDPSAKTGSEAGQATNTGRLPALALDDHLYGGCGGLDEVHTGLSGGDVDEAAVLVKAFARRVRSESHVGPRRRVFADVRQERVEDLAAKSPALA